jgi:predicted nucleic acid-binding protein
VIAVSNTSPLTNLAAIGQFQLLHDLYDSVCIPEAVWLELNANDRQWPGSAEVASASWVERHTVNNRQLVTALEMDLDHGEAEAIALAIQLGANVVLLDEHEGRRIAQRHQLPVVGVVGILLDAKQNGYIDKVMPYVEDLHQVAGFYLSSRIIDRVRRLAGESR